MRFKTLAGSKPGQEVITAFAGSQKLFLVMSPPAELAQLPAVIDCDQYTCC